MPSPLSNVEARITPELRDAAKRASDIVNNYLVFVPFDELRTKTIAIKLENGDTDGVLYDSKRDAVRHQLHEQRCAYFSFRNCAGGTNARDMAIFLQMHREAYSAGMRLVDPDDQFGGKEILLTSARSDFTRGRLGI